MKPAKCLNQLHLPLANIILSASLEETMQVQHQAFLLSSPPLRCRAIVLLLYFDHFISTEARKLICVYRPMYCIQGEFN